MDNLIPLTTPFIVGPVPQALADIPAPARGVYHFDAVINGGLTGGTSVTVTYMLAYTDAQTGEDIEDEVELFRELHADGNAIRQDIDLTDETKRYTRLALTITDFSGTVRADSLSLTWEDPDAQPEGDLARVLEFTTDLAEALPQKQLQGLAYQGEQMAHVFVISAMRRGRPVELTGSVLCLFKRADHVTVAVAGLIQDGKAVVRLSGTCYEAYGRAELAIDVTSAGETVTVFAAVTSVTRTTTQSLIDGGDVITLPALQAEYEHMQIAAADAEAATDETRAATEAANAATEAATSAAERAEAISDQLDDVGVDVTMLPISAAPTAEVTQTDDHTQISLGIPYNSLAYATFEVESATMDLYMIEPENFADVGFALDDGDLYLEVE